MPDRIDAKPVLTVIGASLLLVALFLDWYTVPPVPPETADTAVGSAWTVFESLDLVLAGLAIASIYAAYQGITGRGRLGSGLMLPLGLLALVIVASQLLNPPPTVGSTGDPTTGAWLALGGSAAMAIGGLLSIAGISLALEFDSERGRSTAPTRRRAAQQDA